MPLFLGGTIDDSGEIAAPWHLDTDRLRTHGVVVGMTGSGKTGLCIDLIEEAALDGVPAILIDGMMSSFTQRWTVLRDTSNSSAICLVVSMICLPGWVWDR